MNNCTYAIQAGRLPDVEIYGGDTSPWHVKITDENGRPLSNTRLEGCALTLVAVPYGMSRGLSAGADRSEPILLAMGHLMDTPDGYAVAEFEPDYDETVAMRGKYLYQITLCDGMNERVLQGKLTVKQNISPDY